MLNVRETRQYLKESEFENLFTQVLGWDRHTQTLPVTIDENDYLLTAIAKNAGWSSLSAQQPEPTDASPITQPDARYINR